MKQTLGNLERQLFAYAQMRGLRTLRTGDLTKALDISAKQESKLFTRLSKGRMIAQVRRGLYLIPQRLPLGASWAPSEILALNTLIGDLKGRYQICGPNAFNRYGYDEQVPNRVYAYNNRLYGDRLVGGVQLTLIKVADRRLGSTEETVTADGETGVYSSRARTLLDAVYDWSRFGTLPRAYDWIRADLKKKRVTARDLVQVTLQYGDVGTIRRMGYLLEREAVDPALLGKLRRALKPTRSFIPWIPSKAKRGSIDRRWGVVDNEQT
jgi:predicted transcriptional regulator of viral defense system